MTGLFQGQFEKIDDHRWRIPTSYSKGMRVPGIIYADEKMLRDIIKDNAPEQVANAAHLPGIVRASMAMPDIHWGYGLPIGGVVATDVDAGGVITPGGVGYDINCGVRLLNTSLDEKDITREAARRLTGALYDRVPVGVGSAGGIKLGSAEEKKVLTDGARWAVREGYGWEEDLSRCEENGAIEGADPSAISARAYERGSDQAGTLGSGNHFLEIQVVDEIYDEKAARIFDIRKGRITVMIHTGSRGFGHQICTDYAEKMVGTLSKFGISAPDKQLSSAPVGSKEGREYLGAMRSAANYAWCNRQVITFLVRKAFEDVFGKKAESLGMHVVYDVAHNIAKIEKHEVGGKTLTLCVHRKGATRALPAGHRDVPEVYREAGQPVIIPGDMGRYSYLLAGCEGSAETFYSTCHGAGRLMSRAQAVKAAKNRSIDKELEAKGISVRYKGRDTLREEAPEAYKDVSRVVNIVEQAGISRRVARMRPLGVVKG
jgi:tRNA-splicing ligase RtcB